MRGTRGWRSRRFWLRLSHRQVARGATWRLLQEEDVVRFGKQCCGPLHINDVRHEVFLAYRQTNSGRALVKINLHTIYEAVT